MLGQNVRQATHSVRIMKTDFISGPVRSSYLAVVGHPELTHKHYLYMDNPALNNPEFDSPPHFEAPHFG